MNRKFIAGGMILLLYVCLTCSGCTQGESGSAHAAATTKILAKDVTFQNTSSNSDIASNNIQDAITESNIDLSKKIVGRWSVTSIGYNPNKTGVVNFMSDGTYSIESGYFEAGGSWTGVTTGKYSVSRNIIAFTYTGWDPAAVSRFGMVIYKKPDKITTFVLGHSNGVEQWDKM